jgi:hypothetical protein
VELATDPAKWIPTCLPMERFSTVPGMAVWALAVVSTLAGWRRRFACGASASGVTCWEREHVRR